MSHVPRANHGLLCQIIVEAVIRELEGKKKKKKNKGFKAE